MSGTKLRPLAVSIMGPTASGKTDLAIALREKINGEIISVDSALVYRGMDIGSAKPSRDELSLAPHRLIDIRDPAEPYSAADFCRDAKREIKNLIQQDKTPLLVGGTMLYFKSLLEGLSDLPAADEKVRIEIEKEAQEKGWPQLHAQLKVMDPISAEKIHPNHSQRLSRAIEVFKITGKPLSSFQGKAKGGLLDHYHWLQIAIAPKERSVLHKRIELRFEKMIEQGLLDEVRDLISRGDLHKDLPSMRAVGYRQAWEYLHGEYDFETMREKAIAATRQLAKRQLTWLRSWSDVVWIDTDDKNGKTLSSTQLIEPILNIIKEKAI